MSVVNWTKEDLSNRLAFPAPIILQTVRKRVFDDTSRHGFTPLIEIECAHTLMLASRQIIHLNQAAVYLRALDVIGDSAVHEAKYGGSRENFSLFEKMLTSTCGAEIAGKMRTARNRNHIESAMDRMILRKRLVSIFGALLQLRGELVRLAWEHRLALMPAYTHDLPGEPATLGHYLTAFVKSLERDAQRIIAAYVCVNRCPLDATGLPIDRDYTQQLLGFEGLHLNSYEAIASSDYLADSCSVLATSMLGLRRLAQDLLLWSKAEFSYLRLRDDWVEAGGRTFQKQKPTPLEQGRILAGRALTQAQSINDTGNCLQPQVYEAFANAERSVCCLAGVLREAEFNASRIAASAHEHFAPVAEPPDTLVRATGIDRRAALRASNFAAARPVRRAPVLESEVLRGRARITADERWLHQREQKWASARALIRQQSDALLRQADES